MAARGFLGAGDLYIARYNPALADFDALQGPFEATKFEIKPNVELREMSSRGRTTYGQVIESVPLPQPAEFSIAMPEVNRESLVLALLGTASAINQGAGTITDAPVTAKLGAWVQLPAENFATAGFTVKNDAGTTTYVLGTDYEVNYRLGMIKALKGGAITEGQALEVSGSHNAVSGTRIAGATNSQIRVKLVLDGVNFADQLPVITRVHEAVVAADSAFDFLADEFASIELTGRLKTPAGKTEPFTVDLRDTAA